MHLSRNFLYGKSKYLLGLMLLLFISVSWVAVTMEDNSDFDISRREVILRRIGHELLLKSGDRTSRVLPIEKISENEYQISFARNLTFEPDYLVRITRRFLAKDPLSNDYVVNVLNCSNARTVYSYAISKNEKDDIVTCLGRVQPTGCYKITIKFKSTDIIASKNAYLLGGLPILAFAGFIFLRSIKARRDSPKSKNDRKFTFGSVLFDPQVRQLVINKEIIELTGTETRLLLIFALSPNQTVERNRLQKEIWEDEGIIVGRSLDMFVSKLRKKMELDPDSNIVVVRGKGYKLETVSYE